MVTVERLFDATPNSIEHHSRSRRTRRAAQITEKVMPSKYEQLCNGLVSAEAAALTVVSSPRITTWITFG
jgi:hypothetical protein